MGGDIEMGALWLLPPVLRHSFRFLPVKNNLSRKTALYLEDWF